MNHSDLTGLLKPRGLQFLRTEVKIMIKKRVFELLEWWGLTVLTVKMLLAQTGVSKPWALICYGPAAEEYIILSSTSNVFVYITDFVTICIFLFQLLPFSCGFFCSLHSVYIYNIILFIYYYYYLFLRFLPELKSLPLLVWKPGLLSVLVRGVTEEHVSLQAFLLQ